MKNHCKGWCERYHLTYQQYKELVFLAKRRQYWAVRECNEDVDFVSYHERAYRKGFEDAGKEFGFDGVEWNGLYPTLKKDGYDVYLPE